MNHHGLIWKCSISQFNKKQNKIGALSPAARGNTVVVVVAAAAAVAVD